MKLYQRILFLGTSAALVGSFVFLMAGVSAYLYLAPGLPDVNSLRDVRLQVPLRVYSRDGRLISQLGAQRRIPVAFQDIPQDMVNAFLAAEDDRFFEHPGVDYQGLVRATMMLALTGERRQGGGTITMQLARNFFLTRERTYIRKLKEIFLALRIERELNKQEILTLYLNKIFLGQRAYGVGAASEVYFGKALKDRGLAEIATIAGLPKAPSSDNPVSSPERAGRRRAYVLRRMLEVGYIEQDEAEAAAAIPIESRIHGPAVEVEAPYVAEMVRSELLTRNLPDIYTAGYRVTTSIDSRLQQAAVIALRQALLEYDQLSDDIRAAVDDQMAGYDDPVGFYVDKLCEGIATIAAAFAPEPVIVRMSDFKSNEYANLIGGEKYEPHEENPMLGFRGAARYVSTRFRPCFDLECQALKRVRNDMGLNNVQIMIPFVRSVQQAKDVIAALAENGLERGKDDLKITMMSELPTNALLADQYLEHFDGMSIGSNDMTQLTLGLDRDSALVADMFDERDDAVKALLAMTIAACKAQNKYIGICGQGPSDYPDMARWLLDQGIESISLNPDTVVETWLFLAGEKV